MQKIMRGGQQTQKQRICFNYSKNFSLNFIAANLLRTVPDLQLTKKAMKKLEEGK